MSANDYPRMLFHRSKPPVVVQSKEEEAALGTEWSRIYRPLEGPAAAEEPPATAEAPPAGGEETGQAEPPKPSRRKR